MIFSEKFLEDLKNDPLHGMIILINVARENLTKNTAEWTEQDYQVLLEAYALITEIIESKLLDITPPNFAISGNRDQDCKLTFAYLNSQEEYCIAESSKLKITSLRSHFRTALSSGFSYEFSQGDLERVQLLINQIRELISQTVSLEKDHQRRLLSRLEKLQSEMHKKVSDLDRFWGLIGDAGVVLGKLGTDAKPIVDRIKEIADIVWQTQSRAEELPSGTSVPLLANKSAADSGMD
ncbi:hypothetical protein [Uliginosibacterium sediminicola]|uniref:Uncharacterized protein n=1 Tax=Uliginosibacterium sediminicola TaxID=2024550 RepID=A0ABU9YYS6_9RHOO